MSKVETLTAYKCKFSYLQRNNPLLEEQREDIKAGKVPPYTFSQFIVEYANYTQNMAIGENTDRAILLPIESISSEAIAGKTIRWSLAPKAGKQGQPVTVIKKASRKQYNFNSDSAALYEHHVFAYQKHSHDFVMIFHRQSGSGCKTVFLETANNYLKQKGLKLEMELYVPFTEENSQAIPEGITLKYMRTDVSSDIADNYANSKKKAQQIRSLELNLEAIENRPIQKVIREMQLRKIDKETAFGRIKTECRDESEYNDAVIRFRIGKKHKNVAWNDFERMVGEYDISQELHDQYRKTGNFMQTLTNLSDQYYKKVIHSEAP